MEQYIKTLGFTNFRSDPSLSSTIIRKLVPDTILFVIESVANTSFYRARLEDGTLGYITSKVQYVVNYVPEWEAVEQKIEVLGEAFLGVPYVFGAQRYPIGQAQTSPVFDCSSFQRYIYGMNGVHLLEDSRQQSTQGVYVDLESELRSGDLIFFAYSNGYIHHVAQFVNIDSKDLLLHTYSTTSRVLDRNLAEVKASGGGVTFSDFSVDSYWRKRATLAKRPFSS